MASTKSVALNEKEYDKLIEKFGLELKNSYKAMKGLKTNYEALMKGDANGPYWNGAAALRFYKTAKNNLAKDIAAYNAVFKIYSALHEKRDSWKVKLFKGV